MEIRTLPRFLSFLKTKAVYGDNVDIFVWDEPYHAIWTKSKQVTDEYRSFFNQL